MIKKNKIKQQKYRHNEFVKKKVKEQIIDTNDQYKYYLYKNKKRLTWLHWLVFLIICLADLGIIFLIGFLLKNKSGYSGLIDGLVWGSSFGWIICFLTIIVINYIRNRNAIIYFNDKRMRYQLTFEIKEAKIISWRNIFILIFFTTLFFAIITYII